MRELFPRKQIMGLMFSLWLTVAALTVYFFELSFEVGSTVLLVTAFLQAIIQLSIENSIYDRVLWHIRGTSHDLWHAAYFNLGDIIEEVIAAKKRTVP